MGFNTNFLFFEEILKFLIIRVFEEFYLLLIFLKFPILLPETMIIIVSNRQNHLENGNGLHLSQHFSNTYCCIFRTNDNILQRKNIILVFWQVCMYLERNIVTKNNPKHYVFSIFCIKEKKDSNFLFFIKFFFLIVFAQNSIYFYIFLYSYIFRNLHGIRETVCLLRNIIKVEFSCENELASKLLSTKLKAVTF